MSSVITDPKMRKFVHANVNNEFGLSVAQVAEKCKSHGRFKAWLNSDVGRIKEVLNTVKANGVSPAFFASYERTEGYNPSWGWLNHTKVNGNPITDAKSVSQWIVSQSKNTKDKPAWIDFANYKDFVPASVKQAGNADFANMKSGSIGKVVIAGTAAATWEVYYPNGLKASYNGVKDYGAPINNMIATIEAWGGSLDGSDNGSDPDPDDPDPKPPEYDWDDFFDGINDVVSGGLDKASSNLFGGLDNLLKDLDRLLKELKENILEALKELFNSYMYDYSDQYKSNKYIQVMTTFKNMYKIKPTKLFDELINTVIDTGIKTIKDFMLGKVNDIKNSFTSGVSGIIDDIGGINKPPVINPDPDDPDPDPKPDDPDPVIPTVSDYRLTSGYGFRTSPTTGKWTLHDGIDLAPKVPGTTGVPIYATQDGEVVENFWGDVQGWAIRIKHYADNYYSGYQHLSVKSPIGIGTKVRKGQTIGTMGETGLVTGVHLHFQIATTASGWYTDEGTIDPAKYLGL